MPLDIIPHFHFPAAHSTNMTRMHIAWKISNRIPSDEPRVGQSSKAYRVYCVSREYVSGFRMFLTSATYDQCVPKGREESSS
jgi:hypothetical protein